MLKVNRIELNIEAGTSNQKNYIINCNFQEFKRMIKEENEDYFILSINTVSKGLKNIIMQNAKNGDNIIYNVKMYKNYEIFSF